ncbi:hypothetical protein [Geochorda subterranea]|uniref:Uncharacterized protein n=1 Tax=Geochorda subterranea TaxID=3109564 RepID=A0ABZ1BSV2_9FIRM|nr:hypothetical protein [Limnochorda sp. LNt]WRP15698.1 hypothetical protein VLY81_05965 [Limnochorda sp. LNt]
MGNEGTVAAVLIVLLLAGIWFGIQAGQRHMDAVMNAWVGHSAQELLDVWGPPSRIVTAPPGSEGSLYIYEESDNAVTVTPIYPPPPDGSPPGRPMTFTVSSASGYAYRIFWVDGSGRIYRTAWAGLRWSNRLPNKFPLQSAPAS